MHPPAAANPPALVLGLTALILIATALALDIIDSRSTEFEHGMSQIAQHDRMFAEHVARSFEGVEILLDEMHLVLKDGRRWQEWSDEQGHRYLKERLTRSLPQIRHLIIFDADGRQRHANFALPAPPINIADRPYFIRLQAGAEQARYGPYVGRNSKRPTYAIARRLAEPGNRFGGVLLAAIETEYFEQLCHAIRPFEPLRSALVNETGRIVAVCRPSPGEKTALPPGDDFRQAFALDEFAEWQGGPARRTLVGERHVLTSEPVPGYGDLHIVSATPRETLTQRWQQHAWRAFALALTALSALLAAGVMIRRQVVQLSSLTGELRETQKTLEERILAATRELEARHNQSEQTAEAKSRFFAAASHDLRQPLHALQLFLGDLARKIYTSEQKALVQRIEMAAQAMATQLKSLLDISRLDMANIVPEQVPVSLGSIFEQLATTCRPSVGNPGVRLHLRPLPIVFETDPVLLTRLLGNLVENSIKFAPGGTVFVCARRRGDFLRIEVRDNGPGIALDQQQAIYDEFYQIDNAARNPGAGLGLGLAIAQRIARLLGATIELRSAPGCGSNFIVTLPLQTVDSLTPTPPSSPARLVLLGGFDAGGGNASFSTRAGAWGYDVAPAEDIAGARKLLDDSPGILVVPCTDCAELPPEVLALLRERPSVVVSRMACKIPDIRAYHLREPVKPARLRALLRSLDVTGASHEKRPPA